MKVNLLTMQPDSPKCNTIQKWLYYSYSGGISGNIWSMIRIYFQKCYTRPFEFIPNLDRDFSWMVRKSASASAESITGSAMRYCSCCPFPHSLLVISSRTDLMWKMLPDDAGIVSLRVIKRSWSVTRCIVMPVLRIAHLSLWDAAVAYSQSDWRYLLLLLSQTG